MRLKGGSFLKNCKQTAEIFFNKGTQKPKATQENPREPLKPKGTQRNPKEPKGT